MTLILDLAELIFYKHIAAQAILDPTAKVREPDLRKAKYAWEEIKLVKVLIIEGIAIKSENTRVKEKWEKDQ